MERPGSQWGAAKGKGFCGLRPHPWWHQTFRPVLAVKLMGIIMLRNRCWPINFHTIIVEDVDGWCWKRSPTLGAHTHAHSCPWVLGGHGCDVIVHGWAWVGIGFVHPCIQLQIGVKLLGCRVYANQEALRAEDYDSEQPFICPIQPRLGVGR